MHLTRLEKLTAERVVARIWERDHTVWKDDPSEIADRLGWLDVAGEMRGRLDDLRRFAEEAAGDGITTAVLLGMGGSSLAPELFARMPGAASDGLSLRVLDTTHPAAIAAANASLDLDRTLFIVASKSGTTVETLSQYAHFRELAGRGDRFVAITDPGTPLEKLARDDGFREVFLNPEDIGGRYSAVSLFGLVPAALVGVDLGALLDGADAMAAACRTGDPAGENPGAWLGAVIAEGAIAGRDKLTLVLPGPVASLGDWVEQLVAESTGKEGAGIVPVVGESLGPSEVYRDDRLFVGVGDQPRVEALGEAGHSVIGLPGGGDAAWLGGELFRWEFATAVAGHVLGINPFDQPNVAEAKEATARILDDAAHEPHLFVPEQLLQMLAPDPAHPGYLAIQAFLEPTPDTTARLQLARHALRDRHRVATTLGFGPRYLHSTGQLHKGGPPTGLFVQVVDAERDADVPIPGRDFTFGQLIDAQALGDLLSLQARGRPVARISLEMLEEVAAR